MTGGQQQRYHVLRENVVKALSEYSEAVVKESNSAVPDPKLKFMREQKAVAYKNAFSEFNTYVPGISM